MRGFLNMDLVLLNEKYPGVLTDSASKIFRRVISPFRSQWLCGTIRRERERYAEMLNSIPELNEIHEEHQSTHYSSGVDVSDYVRLYRVVRAIKPKAVLECGTGRSTSAIACALKHNMEESGVSGKCISMEEIPEFAEKARELLPEKLRKFVEIIQSQRVERHYRGFRGVCYEEVPKLDYQFAFIDGPNQNSPITGEKLFDMDFVYAVEANPNVQGFIDHRLSTVKHLKIILRQTHHVVYHPVSKLGYIYPVGGKIAF